MNARRMKVVELGVVCLALMVAARPCRADAASDRRIFDKLLLAIEANDYDGFLADGNDGFKASLTKQALHLATDRWLVCQ